jgi:pyruvate dehydrogenase E1 component alpha subunit
LGEGATNTGSFYSGLNLAAVWKLPLIAIVENNRYGMGTAFERVSAVGDVYRKASAFDIPGVRIDGNDVLAVRDAVRRMANRSRTGGGPQLIEAMTYRFRGHSMGDPQRYRTKEEVEDAKTRDPIARWRRAVLENEVATEDELRTIVGEVEAGVEEAVRFAENSPVPDPSELYNDVLVPE